jgi:hypothetical protein
LCAQPHLRRRGAGCLAPCHTKRARESKTPMRAQWRPTEPGLHRQELEIVPMPAICRRGLCQLAPNAPRGATISSVEMYYPPLGHSCSCRANCALCNTSTGARNVTVLPRSQRGCHYRPETVIFVTMGRVPSPRTCSAMEIVRDACPQISVRRS